MKYLVKSSDGIALSKNNTLQEAHDFVIKEVIQQLLNLPFDEKKIMKIWKKIQKEAPKPNVPWQLFLDESGIDLRYEIHEVK